MPKKSDKYADLETSLEAFPFISAAQVEQWVGLQKTIDQTKDYLINAVPDARHNVEEAQKILEQREYTLVFFGGTGVGKSTLINSLLGRNLLPTGAVTAVTGTIVYIEQADEGEEESLTLNYWSKDEFAVRVRRLCELAQMDGFDITNDAEREQAQSDINDRLAANADVAKTEQDEYLDILLDCISTYENHAQLMKSEMPPPAIYPLSNEEAYTHLREDGFKGSSTRQIRLIKSATFKIKPNPLLIGGYLRIVDVPGLGAGMRLHEAITLEEMKKEDAMIVIVADAGRQRVDEMKSLQAVHWIKENRLYGLRGSDLDDAAAKIFFAINGANVRQAFDRLATNDTELREVTRHIAPNYWEKYADRGGEKPYFFVMPPVALYLADPDNAPTGFAGEVESVLKEYSAELNATSDDPFDKETKEALMALSEVPELRESLIAFIRNERVRTQLREASNRTHTALRSLRSHYEGELAMRGVFPPFDTSWETLQEKRYENVLYRHRKELPRAFHSALVEMSQRYNSDASFRSLVRPTLNNIKATVAKTIEREIETLLESYGTEHWDDRDVTYDNLIWGTSGIELPIKRILYQVELAMQENIGRYMPQLAELVTQELRRTLESHELRSRLTRANYEQGYNYTLPSHQGEAFGVVGAYDALIERVEVAFRQICEQATMYELVKPERSVHYKLAQGESALALSSNEMLLDVALNGVEAVQGTLPAGSGDAAVAEPVEQEEELVIKILNDEDDLGINFGDEPAASVSNDLELSYADMLDNVSLKTNRIFGSILDDLFGDDQLLPRLRRLFWLEATRAERDFNNHIVKPMLRQHDRNMTSDTLRAMMEPDLESISDLEALMRTWEGLDKLESEMTI